MLILAVLWSEWSLYFLRSSILSIMFFKFLGTLPRTCYMIGITVTFMSHSLKLFSKIRVFVHFFEFFYYHSLVYLNRNQTNIFIFWGNDFLFLKVPENFIFLKIFFSCTYFVCHYVGILTKFQEDRFLPFYWLFYSFYANFLHSLIMRLIIQVSYHIISTCYFLGFIIYSCGFFTPTIAAGFSLEFELQQVSLSLQDSSQYSCSALVLIVSTCPHIYQSFTIFTSSLGIVSSAPNDN